jgi:hypothetical protein
MNQEEKNKFASFLGRSILKYHKKIKISFHPSEKLVQGKVESTGWADNKELRIATAGDVNVWLGVFVHETCHVDQGIERPEWTKQCEMGVGTIDEWLAGKKYSKTKIKQSITEVIELEWDCEWRSLFKIKSNKLPINIREYAQMANAYILGYHWTLKNRKWCKKSYSNEKIWKAMPTKLIPLSSALYPDKELIGAFDEP